MKILTVYLRGGPLEVSLSDQEAARVLNLVRSPLGKEINMVDVHGSEVAFLAGHIDAYSVRPAAEPHAAGAPFRESIEDVAANKGQSKAALASVVAASKKNAQPKL